MAASAITRNSGHEHLASWQRRSCVTRLHRPIRRWATTNSNAADRVTLRFFAPSHLCVKSFPRVRCFRVSCSIFNPAKWITALMYIMFDIVVFLVGFGVVYGTVGSAIRTFVLPRGDNVWLTRMIFRSVFRLFQLRLKRKKQFAQIEPVLALFSPTVLFIMPILWLLLVMLGYTAMFWAVGVRPVQAAFLLSGSSVLTLGFATVATLIQTVLAFSAAIIGLILIALLIAYLPTMYSAFSRREAAVTLLEVRAGSPPAAITMIERYHRIHNLARMSEQWPIWEAWFSDLEESHTTFSALSFFRSPHPERSWITAAGAVMDAAALSASTLDIPRDPTADLCIRAGFLALRQIADFFRLPHNDNPKSDDPISITRAEYDAACEHLLAAGVPLKPDRDQAWRDFVGWRVNYDDVLLALTKLVTAPPAMWTGTRPYAAEAPTYQPVIK